jgi:thioredoxin 1
MATVEVTDATFDQVVLKSDKPVLVDYWADWCAPCKQIAPVLEELSNTYAGQLVIAKIDTNTNMNTPARFGVMGLPTLHIFSGGEIVAEMVGAKSKGAIVKVIEQHI